MRPTDKPLTALNMMLSRLVSVVPGGGPTGLMAILIRAPKPIAPRAIVANIRIRFILAAGHGSGTVSLAGNPTGRGRSSADEIGVKRISSFQTNLAAARRVGWFG